MIEIREPGQRPLWIGHRGAAALAPENTLRGFRAAVTHDVDVIEFDVLDLTRGPLVVAHSDHLDEVSHGAATGSVRTLTLDALRDVAPELPTFDEALAFFSDEAPHVGVHIDLKLTIRLDEVAAAIRRHGLERRTVVSSHHRGALRAFARSAEGVRVGYTYPADRLGISRRPGLWPLVALGLSGMRASVPYRVGRLAQSVGAGVVMLQHRLVTRVAVERLHAAGLPVVTWTVDEPDELRRVVEAGVDGVVSNDPRMFFEA